MGNPFVFNNSSGCSFGPPRLSHSQVHVAGDEHLCAEATQHSSVSSNCGSQGSADGESSSCGSQGTAAKASGHGHNATMLTECAERASSSQRTERTDAQSNETLQDGSQGTNLQIKRQPSQGLPEGEPLRALGPTNLLCIELCCGSAGRTSALFKAGFSFMAVDHKHNKHRPAVPVLALDLRSSHLWAFLERICETRQVFFIRAGPPCGTASRAREIPMPGSGYTCQLRSETHPMGLPNVSASDAEKVASANAI